jgi:arylsulfatase A-like enzyme
MALAVVWAGASAVAFWLVCRPLHGWPVSWTALSCLGASLLLIPAAEALFAVILLSGSATLRRHANRPWSRAASWAAIVATGLFLTGGLMATALSWWTRAQGPNFLQGSVLWSGVAGVSTLIPWVGHAEILAFAIALVIALAITALLIRISPPLTLPQLGALFLAFAATLAALFVSSRLIPRRLLDTYTAIQIQAIFKNDLLPSATFLWGGILFPTALPPAPSQALTPREPLPAPDPSRARPNIILFVIESLRGGEETRVVNGVPVMPTVSRLAREGIRFTRAYAPSNESAISWSSILTSLHALKYEVRDSYRWSDSPIVRFYDVVSPAYATGFFSSSNEDWQDMARISNSPKLDRFFDANAAANRAIPVAEADAAYRQAVRKHWLKSGNLDDRTTTEALQQWIGERSRATPRKPFLGVVSYQTSHFPYQEALDVPSRFMPCELSAADLQRCSFVDYPPEFAERMKNRYWNSLFYIDGLIEQTIGMLRQSGLLDRTVLIVTGDHGEMFYENGAGTHAKLLSEGVLHVPLVVWGAAPWSSRAYTQPVSLLDVAPMILQLASFPIYLGFQGRVPPGLEGGVKGQEPSAVFATAQNLAFEDSVVAGDWRLTRHEDGLYEHLYNVAADPLEREESSARNPDVLRCLDATLKEFRKNQLGYYAHPDLVKSSDPPATQLAQIPACRVFDNPCLLEHCQ